MPGRLYAARVTPKEAGDPGAWCWSRLPLPTDPLPPQVWPPASLFVCPPHPSLVSAGFGAGCRVAAAGCYRGAVVRSRRMAPKHLGFMGSVCSVRSNGMAAALHGEHPSIIQRGRQASAPRQCKCMALRMVFTWQSRKGSNQVLELFLHSSTAAGGGGSGAGGGAHAAPGAQRGRQGGGVRNRGAAQARLLIHSLPERELGGGDGSGQGCSHLPTD